MPINFFHALASLWRVVLQTSKVPEPWLAVRCVLIPKDIGLRPISVASLAWRTGTGVLAHQLAHWFNSWTPPELVGGLKGRSVATVHEQLHNDLQWPSICGAKIDIAKCFDHVHVKQALLIWEKLGAPRSVTSLLQAFYSGQTKVMEWQGFSARKPIECTRGLLQGCPLSCGLLAGLMSTWYWHVKTLAPLIRMSIFIDDRTLWSDNRHELFRALEASAVVEQALGLQLNHTKCEIFHKGNKSQLIALNTWCVNTNRNWSIRKHFKLLGVHYVTSRGRRTPVEDKAVSKVNARLRRLRIASRNQARKRKLVRSLILSLFVHTGPWTTLPRKFLKQWASYLGPHLDPEFALDSRVILHELWKVKKEVSACQNLSQLAEMCNRQPQPSAFGRLGEVLQKWKWQQVSFTTCFCTPQGLLDLAFDGQPAVKEAMKHAWIAYLWRKEPRADYIGQNIENPLPNYKAHSVWMRQAPRLDPESFSIAAAAGKNSRKLAKQHSLDLITCACGHEWPSCSHVTWNCPSCVAIPEVTAPVSTSEERLLIRCINWPPGPTDRANDFFATG